MPIIIRIREFLKLENKTTSINTDFSDSVGLFLTEGMIRKIENTPSMDCLINHANAINFHHDILQNSDLFDSVHVSNDLHF